MQLTRRVAVLAVSFLSASPAHADTPEVTVDAKGSLYQDDDATTIVTATTRVGVEYEGFRAHAGYLVDVITTASVDVVTAATDRWGERRDEVAGDVSYAFGLWTLSGEYIFSHEPDWESHTAGIGLSGDLLERNLTVAAGYGFVLNDVGRAGDENFSERMMVHSGTLSLAQILGPGTVLRGTYSFSAQLGFLSNVYRYVITDDGAFTAPESHPDSRLRHALALRLAQYLFDSSSLHADYRFYLDSWAMTSHTLGLKYFLELGKHVTLRVRDRIYFQTAARFYEPGYESLSRYMSADRELSRFVSNLVGVKVTFATGKLAFLEDLRFDIKAEYFYYRFFEFPRLPERHGMIGEVGLSAVF